MLWHTTGTYFLHCRSQWSKYEKLRRQYKYISHHTETSKEHCDTLQVLTCFIANHSKVNMKITIHITSHWNKHEYCDTLQVLTSFIADHSEVNMKN